MGNHSIGAAFAGMATLLAERRREGETALDILDTAADRSGVRGMDAEFDDATELGEPFADLIVEAFGDGQTFDDTEEGYDAFYDGPYAAFNKRYRLC